MPWIVLLGGMNVAHNKRAMPCRASRTVQHCVTAVSDVVLITLFRVTCEPHVNI